MKAEKNTAIIVEQERPTRQRVVLAFVLLITLLISYLDRVNVSVLIADKTFLTDMGILGDPVKMGLLLTTFLFAYGASNLLLSPLGDYLGPRKAMCISILLWAGSLLLGGIASTFMAMIVARVVLGLGEGMHWPMQSKFVKNWFPPGERAKANAAWLFGLMAGPAMAMPFFTWMVANYGWRPVFFFLASLSIIPLVLIWFFTADTPRDSKKVNKEELTLIETALAEEAKYEVKQESFWKGIKYFAGNYRFWLNAINYYSNAIVWWGTMAWLPSYLKVARGFSWGAMGALSALPYLLGVICLIYFAHLSDKTGRRAPFAAASMLIASLGVYFGAMATDNVTSAIMISIGIAGLGIGMPANHSILQQLVPANTIGAGAGMMNGTSSMISAMSPTIIGMLIATTGSYVGGLMFLVGAGVIGFSCMMILVYQKY